MIELSPEAIANYQVQVNACQARMRDGTLVSLEPGAGVDRADLKEALQKEPTVRVFLAVPKLRMGRPNVGPGPENGTHRYSENLMPLQDESRGGNDQEI